MCLRCYCVSPRGASGPQRMSSQPAAVHVSLRHCCGKAQGQHGWVRAVLSGPRGRDTPASVGRLCTAVHGEISVADPIEEVCVQAGRAAAVPRSCSQLLQEVTRMACS